MLLGYPLPPSPRDGDNTAQGGLCTRLQDNSHLASELQDSAHSPGTAATANPGAPQRGRSVKGLGSLHVGCKLNGARARDLRQHPAGEKGTIPSQRQLRGARVETGDGAAALNPAALSRARKRSPSELWHPRSSEPTVPPAAGGGGRRRVTLTAKPCGVKRLLHPHTGWAECWARSQQGTSLADLLLAGQRMLRVPGRCPSRRLLS